MWFQWNWIVTSEFCSQCFHFLSPSAEKNTWKAGECFVFVWTRSGAYKKPFGKTRHVIAVRWNFLSVIASENGPLSCFLSLFLCIGDLLQLWGAGPHGAPAQPGVLRWRDPGAGQHGRHHLGAAVQSLQGLWLPWCGAWGRRGESWYLDKNTTEHEQASSHTFSTTVFSSKEYSHTVSAQVCLLCVTGFLFSVLPAAI